MSEESEIRQLMRSLLPELRAAVIESSGRGLDALKKPEDLSLPRWAHRHFYLSAESSQSEEEWRAWPFQIGLLYAMGDDNVKEFTFFKSARLGYTKCLLADIAWTAQHQRRNQCIWQPTDKDSDDFCKTDLEPMLRDVRIMRTVFPRVLEKSKINTLQQKKFMGSLCKLRGGTAAGNYRRLTIAKGRADELDGFDQTIEKAGTPDALIRKRVEGATYPKCTWGSTGRKRGLSHIERLYGDADIRMRFRITCPHCDEEHPLQWGGKTAKHGFKWDMHDPQGTVRHHCPHCYGSITQADYLRLARVGCWVSECGNYRLRHWWDEAGEPCAEWTTATGVPCLPPPKVAMHCWTAYSEQPGVTWANILQDFLDALKAWKTGNREPMIAWVNETKGETYLEEGDQADVNELHTRAKASLFGVRTVPDGALILGAGVDVQDNRFEVVVWAAGRNEGEMWAIDYMVIDANPADLRDWAKLWDALQVQYRHARGGWVGIAGAAVDTGYGNYTHEAYAFVAKYSEARDDFKLYAVKGSSTEGDPIKARAAKWMTINLKGRLIKRGVKLWHVGTDTAKDLFFNRIKIAEPGPGFVHFARDLPPEFFKQYGNERRVKHTVNGRETNRWYHHAGANEVIDCTVYALFVFEALGVASYTEERWKKLENQLLPDLFDSEPPAHAALPMVPDQAAIIVPPAPPATRPTPQKPQQAARKAPTAQPAPNPFASEEWMARG
jgi:phage terminase large subunit GpA-like protein